MTSRADEAISIAGDIFGRPVDRVDRMVASSVRAIRLGSGGETLIAARRPSEDRAALEAAVLTGLSEHGAPVPGLIAQRGRWVFQEDLPGERLSIALWNPAHDAEASLPRALETLARIHEAGRRAGLDQCVARLGTAADWRRRLAGMPERLAQASGIALPDYDRTALADRIAPRAFALVKWDARPANAMLSDDGAIRWFDWEHCGCRDPLDDAAWLLGDEYLPDPDSAALLEHAVERIAGNADGARAYLLAMTVLHMSVRLALILEKRDSHGGWRDWETCLKLDKVGSTAPAFRRTAARAGRWAAEGPHLAPLAPFFEALADWTPDE